MNIDYGMIRSDGVTFDWEISSEEMKERERDAVGVEKSTSRVATTAPDSQIKPSIAITTTTITTSPTTVNQSGPESSSSSHRSSNLSSSSTRTTDTAPRPVVYSTEDTSQASVDAILRDVVIKQEEMESTIPPTPAPSHEVPPNVHSSIGISPSATSNSSTPLALSPQSVIASPNSLSNIAVCFLDR